VRDFMFREHEVVHTLGGLISANLERHRIEGVTGQAVFEDAHILRVNAKGRRERQLTAPVILVATGSRPGWPEGVPRDPGRLYDSDSILHMLLGVRVRLDAYLEQVRLDGPEVVLQLRGGQELTAECVLFTMGRGGDLSGLVKLVFSATDLKLLGVHILGDGLRAGARGPGLPALRRHHRLLHPVGFQPPDAGRGVQVRGVRRPGQPRPLSGRRPTGLDRPFNAEDAEARRGSKVHVRFVLCDPLRSLR